MIPYSITVPSGATLTLLPPGTSCGAHTNPESYRVVRVLQNGSVRSQARGPSAAKYAEEREVAENRQSMTGSALPDWAASRSLVVVLALVLFALLTSLDSFAGTIQGQFQNSGGGGLPNGTLTFSLTQPAVVSGTASVVPSPFSCYTDAFGNTVGEPNPLLAPVLSSNLAAGTLASGTYYVKISYQDSTGVTSVSPEAILNLPIAGTLIVIAPVKQPASSNGYQIFIGTSSGTETLQGTITGVPGAWGNYSQASALVAGSAMPPTNTTQCKLRFNDELQPSFTCYNTSLSNQSGTSIPGYPQYWYLYGGTNGTVNVSTGTPQSTICQGSGVVYPQAIVSTPAASSLQSINGPLSLNGFNLTGVGQFRGVCDASTYSGSDAGGKINAAMADATCVIVDAGSLGSPSASSTVSVATGKGLLLGSYVFTVGADPGFQLNTNAWMIGHGRNNTIITTTSGTADIIRVASGANAWGVYDLLVQSSVARTAGAGLRVSGGNGFAERLLINPVFDAITLDTVNSSGLNTFRDIEIGDGYGSPSAGSGGTFHCGVKHGGVASGTVSGNIFDNVNIVMLTGFTDAGFCIQDGSDTVTIINSQAVANQGGSDSIALHLETVNGGNAPANTKIIGGTYEGGLTKNTVVHDSGINTEFDGVTFQSGLRGLLVNAGDKITVNGGTFHLNQQEGLRITGGTDTASIGARYSNNSQQTTNTYDDIFVAANLTQFKLTGNTHKDLTATGKVCKWGIEVAAGTSNNYSITNDINNASCTTGAISDNGTGTAKHVCNPGSTCNVGSSQILTANGSLSAPPVAFASSTNTGWHLSLTNLLYQLSYGGTAGPAFTAVNEELGSGMSLGWTATADPNNSNPDIRTCRSGINALQIGNTGTTCDNTGELDVKIIGITATTFANLGTPGNGQLKYCSDCTVANPCAGAGTGALAKRLNGAWVCN